MRARVCVLVGCPHVIESGQRAQAILKPILLRRTKNSMLVCALNPRDSVYSHIISPGNIGG